jgi:hypothetical protein
LKKCSIISQLPLVSLKEVTVKLSGKVCLRLAIENILPLTLQVVAVV